MKAVISFLRNRSLLLQIGIIGKKIVNKRLPFKCKDSNRNDPMNICRGLAMLIFHLELRFPEEIFRQDGSKTQDQSLAKYREPWLSS